MNGLTQLRAALLAVTMFLGAAGTALAGNAAVGDQVTVTLVGGSKITAILLRQNEKGIALDLGADVINVSTERILDISKSDANAAKDQRVQHEIYTTGKLEAAPVPELVKKFGDSVVMVRTPIGLGTGFFISDKGHLITNYHVVEGQTKVEVILFRAIPQGYEKLELKEVKILALQPLRDIALLQIDSGELKGEMPKGLVINDRDDLRVGDLVFAIGNPLGLERTVTQGIVSSTTRTIDAMRLTQIDAPINPGNSGGPLFNARGEVVGIACAGALAFHGLAFGIPSCDLIDFLNHRDSYLYDPSSPQNGMKYLQPPFRKADAEKPQAAPARNVNPQPSEKQP